MATEIFVFDVEALSEVVVELVETEEDADRDAEDTDEDGDPLASSLGDYGETIIPAFVDRGTVREYRHDGYWRDIGTIEAFHLAHREILAGEGLRLDEPGWPLLTNPPVEPPARIDDGARVSASLIAPGTRIAGTVADSVIGPGVTVEAGAEVRNAILFGNVTVPAGAVLDTVIADVAAAIPEGETRGTLDEEDGIVILTPDTRAPSSEDETTGGGVPAVAG